VINTHELQRRTGFASADDVRAAVTRMAVQQAFASREVACPKVKCGRRGLPKDWVERMYAFYRRCGSVRATARHFGRSPQALDEIFARRRMRVEPKNFHARILFRGLAWTPGKHGYRPTTGDRSRLLHHEMWEAFTGRKLPRGCRVTFKNGDTSDFRRINLVMGTAAEVTLLHYARRFPQRARMTATERREFWKAHQLKRYHNRARAFIRAGLRSNGKRPRRLLARDLA
jgi:hypothetical protein